MSVLVSSSLLGATIIEKHFTHDKSLPGNDHYHAMDKEDIKVFRRKMDRIMNTIGNIDLSYGESEEISRLNARRSLVAAQDIPKGGLFTVENVTWKRPGHGINPMDYDKLIGKKAALEIKTDDILSWENVE